MEKELLKNIKEELFKHSEEKYRVGSKRYFKEQIEPMGVRSGTVREVAKIFFNSSLKNKSREEILNISEYFLKNGEFFEEKLVAFVWLRKLLKKLEKKDLITLESFLYKYVHNWAHCDDLCTGILGKVFLNLPNEVSLANKWVKDPNRWVRRAAYVSLIPLAKSEHANEYLNFILEILKNSFKEEDDLVRKGAGWLLREFSKQFPNEVFKFILDNKNSLPRVTIRNGIELLDENKKKLIMEK